MRQSIQKQTKQNLSKTAFKKFEGIQSAILLGPFFNTLSQMKFIRTSGRIYLESLKITSYLQRLVKDNEVLSQT